MGYAGRVPMFLLLMLLVLTGSSVMVYMADGNLASGWTNNTVRNWEQYGLFTLKGRMVINPGGYEALTKPVVYKGHRAASMYPAFFIKRLFAWTGAGILVFHIALSLAILLSTWFLLGKSRIGWLAAAAAILAPGYACHERILCPVGTPLLMGLPFAAIVLPLLVRSSLSPSALAVLLLTTVAYSTLNWATAFVHGMVLTYLLASRRASRSRGWLYLGAAGVSLALVASISVLDRRGGTGLMQFVSGYFWGSKGYGMVVTTDRAVVRLLFVGTVGLLPLLLVCGHEIVQRVFWKSKSLWRTFSPLLVAVFGVGAMRNYFAIQPWMAVPVLLVGLILSMRLMLEESQAASTVDETQPGGKILAPVAFLAGCFVYGALVTVLARVQQAPDLQSLVALVRTHTTRMDVVVLLDTNSRLTSISHAVAEGTDRRVVVLNDLSASQQIPGHAFLLSTSGDVKLPLLGRTRRSPLASYPPVQNLLAFYRTRISRRLPGDQPCELGTCYLYALPPHEAAASAKAIPASLTGPM